MFHYLRKIAHKRKSDKSEGSPTRPESTATTSSPASSPAVERLRSHISKGKERGDAGETKKTSMEGRGRQERPSAQPDRGEAAASSTTLSPSPNPRHRSTSAKSNRMSPTPATVPCQYRTGKTLGSGTYAIVKEAVHIKTGQYYACKVINKKLMEGREYMVRNEIAVLKKVSRGNPNIVTLHDYFEVSFIPFRSHSSLARFAGWTARAFARLCLGQDDALAGWSPSRFRATLFWCLAPIACSADAEFCHEATHRQACRMSVILSMPV